MEQNNQLTEQHLKSKAIEYDKILRRNIYETFLLLYGMYQEKLYLYLGYDTLEEYCEDTFGWARRTMYNYLEIAQKFPQILPKSQEVHAHALEKLGIRKLTILAKLDHEQRSFLQKDGEIIIGEKTYTINALITMSCVELEELITGEKEVAQKEKKQDPVKYFDKVYNRTEKYFDWIITNTMNFDSMLKPDRLQIEVLIKRAALIFDKYKKDFDILKKL